MAELSDGIEEWFAVGPEGEKLGSFGDRYTCLLAMKIAVDRVRSQKDRWHIFKLVPDVEKEGWALWEVVAKPVGDPNTVVEQLVVIDPDDDVNRYCPPSGDTVSQLAKVIEETSPGFKR